MWSARQQTTYVLRGLLILMVGVAGCATTSPRASSSGPTYGPTTVPGLDAQSTAYWQLLRTDWDHGVLINQNKDYICEFDVYNPAVPSAKPSAMQHCLNTAQAVVDGSQTLLHDL